MKIHLLRDHTALITNDGKPTVTTEPASAGVLEIEGRRFEIAESGTAVPPQNDLIGRVRVIFTAESGVRYTGIRPRVENGMIESALDYQSEYAKVRIRLDDVERQVDKLTEGFHRLYNETRHDALGFLTHNTRKTEEK